ncbi:molybdenum cofactor guanylyltransferase [Antarcticibacterium sp. 1MA-6-2]|uniref:molybdenum cofactor guanylyltransferase n=1 Tax=Antarcticibacterium sp. 1MA-6-2 TaxID=2908210 RepID=UPI001F1B4639|nr:molybdenum cofactor guanylyltransferase [Antarcticibacterium sp. 1MA-6-2]UJH92878.1 molybdenum cofactor guanylyltransferase [Antarcticibacterium sp. 1MA-6-2]
MGRDKGMMLLKGKPMISHILEAFNEAEIPVNIIANDSSYESLRFPVFADIVSEKGPMGGLLTAIKYSKAEVIFLVSCDMPLISSNALKHFFELGDREHIVAATVEERVNPLFALYPVCLQQELEIRIAEGRLKMTDMILENKHILVPSIAGENPQLFRNVNNEEDFRILEDNWNHLSKT